jgi:hypothetical protein
MRMPVLELTAEMLGTRLALAYVEGVMVWPNNAQQRVLAFDTAHAAYTQGVIAQAAEASMPIPLSSHDLLSVMSGLAGAIPLESMQNSARRLFIRGFIAGNIFCQALIDHEVVNKRGLQAIKSEIIDRYRRKPNFENLSLGTVENLIWGIYKPVAHLWAAAIAYQASREQPRPFPCTLSYLPTFLAISESFRLKGESIQPRQSGGRLLDPAKTWAVAPSLPLPEIDTDWCRLTVIQKCSKAE